MDRYAEHMPIDLDERSLTRSASAKPLYRQLADLIRAAIEDGRLRPGEELLGEEPMRLAVGISRESVRKALNVLASEGLIARRHGAATRVVETPPQHHLYASRYADVLAIVKAGGSDTDLQAAFAAEHGIDWADYTCDVDVTKEAATDEDVQRLQVAPGATLLRRRLVQSVQGVPVQLQHSAMAWDLAGGTAVADPNRQPWPGGTVAELYSLGIVVTRVVGEARTRMSRPDEQEALRMETPGPVFDMVRVFWAGERPVEASRVIAPGTRSVLHYDVELDLTDVA